jgi:hypothetical protein
MHLKIIFFKFISYTFDEYFKTDFSLPMIKKTFCSPAQSSVMISQQLQNYHLHNIKYLTCTYENTQCCESETTPSQ